jgi:glucokinase
MNDRTIGVDVGGTKTAAALVDAAGRILARTTVPTPLDRGSHGVLDAMARAARTVDPDRTAGAAGVGTGGVVDPATGTVLSATALLPDWKGTRVGPRLGELLGITVRVDNDANALAAGELRYGSLTGARGTALFAAVGTGVGGALVLDGALRHGTHRTAGGVGHLPVGGERRCSCGRPGHLESVAAGPSIAAAYAQQAGDTARPDLREVVRRGEAGDAVARRVLAHAAGALGRALAGAANLIDPDTVVLGGGVASIGPLLWEPLREAFAPELLPPLRGLGIRPATLGPDASVIGAAALAA